MCAEYILVHLLHGNRHRLYSDKSARFLLANGANVQTKSGDNRNALQLAIENGVEVSLKIVMLYMSVHVLQHMYVFVKCLYCMQHGHGINAHTVLHMIGRHWATV